MLTKELFQPTASRLQIRKLPVLHFRRLVRAFVVAPKFWKMQLPRGDSPLEHVCHVWQAGAGDVFWCGVLEIEGWGKVQPDFTKH